MDRRIDAEVARAELGQIIDRVTRQRERFIVDKQGEPAVVIMSVEDYVDSIAPAPDWLKRAWEFSAERGLTSLLDDEIDTEITAERERATRSPEI